MKGGTEVWQIWRGQSAIAGKDLCGCRQYRYQLPFLAGSLFTTQSELACLQLSSSPFPP
jgi:hypothetical protein